MGFTGLHRADKITVESRRAGMKAQEGVRWISAARATSRSNPSRAARGTSVILHLRDDAEEFLNAWKLKQVIGKYSDHISLPILMEKRSGRRREEGEPGGMVKTGEWETVNKASALWTRAQEGHHRPSSTRSSTRPSATTLNPLTWSHNRVEGNTEYTQLLYIPAKAPFDLWNRDKKPASSCTSSACSSWTTPRR